VALSTHRAAVRAAFDDLFHAAGEERRREEQPELGALIEELDQEERALWRLGQLGVQGPGAGLRRLRLLRDGPPHAPASARRRQALAALAPALLAEIARSATPNRALANMATFVSTIGARTSYLHLLLENPGVMRLLVRLFASSEFLSAFFLRHPELLDSLVRADLVRLRRTTEDMAAELNDRLAVATDLEAQLDTLRRFRNEEFLRIGVHDIEADLRAEEVAEQLSCLAETCLRAAVGIARHEVLARSGVPARGPSEGFAVLGMGKLGSAELGYASDLDLIYIYDPGDLGWWTDRAVPHEFFTRIAQRTMSALQTPTREGVAYRIDTRLRPSGNQGAARFVARCVRGLPSRERAALGATGVDPRASGGGVRGSCATGSRRSSPASFTGADSRMTRWPRSCVCASASSASGRSTATIRSTSRPGAAG
jgi:glutamate-ammonia-ligase adenylyltransferase